MATTRASRRDPTIGLRFHDRTTLRLFLRSGVLTGNKALGAYIMARAWAGVADDVRLDEHMAFVVANRLQADFGGLLQVTVFIRHSTSRREPIRTHSKPTAPPPRPSVERAIASRPDGRSNDDTRERKRQMPNWMCSGFTVTGAPAEVDRFKNMMFRRKTDLELEESFDPLGRGLKFDFNGIIPMPAEEALSNYEGWAVRNWGSKWNADNLCVIREEEGKMRFQFDTPWDFPTPVFEALADEFPGLVFRGSAFEDNNEIELKGEFNGADDWGPGKTDSIVIKLFGGDDDDDDNDDDD